LDIFFIVQEPLDQALIGILFILFGFAASNALQKKWRLATSWTLLAVGDFLLLVWVNLIVQVIAIILVITGLAILLYEFYLRYRQERTKIKPKKKNR
jgi:hypothetical protein